MQAKITAGTTGPTMEVTHGAPAERPGLGQCAERATDLNGAGRAATSNPPRALSDMRGGE